MRGLVVGKHHVLVHVAERRVLRRRRVEHAQIEVLQTRLTRLLQFARLQSAESHHKSICCFTRAKDGGRINGNLYAQKQRSWEKLRAARGNSPKSYFTSAVWKISTRCMNLTRKRLMSLERCWSGGRSRGDFCDNSAWRRLFFSSRRDRFPRAPSKLFIAQMLEMRPFPPNVK